MLSFASANHSKALRKKRISKEFHAVLNCKYLYLLLLPALLDVLIFRYGPMYGLQIAFKDFDIALGMGGSKWCGFDNFISFFRSPYFLRLFRNTLLISFYLILFSFPAPILFALCLNECKFPKFKKFTQTVSYLPHFIASVVVVGMVLQFLSPQTGIVNQLLESFGMEPIYFMSKPEYFRSIYVIMTIWKTVGFSAIIYIAAMSSIDPELYEAADLDGAGRLQRIWHITLPGIKSTIVILFIMRMGGILNVDWQEILLLQNSYTKEVSDVIQTYVYEKGLINADYGFSTAVDLFRSVIGFILVLMTNWISKKTMKTGLF